MSSTQEKFLDQKMISLGIIFLIQIALFGFFHVPDTLDARLYYTEAEALQFFSGLSQVDFHNYRITEMIDLSFIMSYTAFLYLCLKRLSLKRPQIRFLAFAPAVFDCIETISIIFFIVNHHEHGQFAWLGSITFLKWITSLSLFLLALVLLIQNARKT